MYVIIQKMIVIKDGKHVVMNVVQPELGCHYSEHDVIKEVDKLNGESSEIFGYIHIINHS